jgi:tetratricopeptide (TPR) repeat protein
MSVAPLPKPEVSRPEPADADGWALLDALRRKLDDQASQTRKASAQVGQLAESIAALVEAQRKRSRWLNLNTFAAYLVFTILLGGGFYYVYQSRVRELVGARDQAVTERDAADAKAAQANARLARREADARTAEAKAVEAKAAPKAAAAPESARADLAIQNARASFKAGRFGEAIGPLDAALATQPPGARAAELHYLLGIARAKAGELDTAIAHLETALAANVPDDDARFQLASALDRAGQWSKARAEYDRFASAHPQSPFTPFALRRSATLVHPQPSSLPPGTAGTSPAATFDPAGPIRALVPEPRPTPTPQPPATP